MKGVPGIISLGAENCFHFLFFSSFSRFILIHDLCVARHGMHFTASIRFLFPRQAGISLLTSQSRQHSTAASPALLDWMNMDRIVSYRFTVALSPGYLGFMT